MLLSSRLPLPNKLALSAHLVHLPYFGFWLCFTICQYLKKQHKKTTDINIDIVRLVYHLHILVEEDKNDMKHAKVSKASATLVKSCGNICTIHWDKSFRN